MLILRCSHITDSARGLVMQRTRTEDVFVGAYGPFNLTASILAVSNNGSEWRGGCTLDSSLTS
jgi:hypothetical protein